MNTGSPICRAFRSAFAICCQRWAQWGALHDSPAVSPELFSALALVRVGRGSISRSEAPQWHVNDQKTAAYPDGCGSKFAQLRPAGRPPSQRPCSRRGDIASDYRGGRGSSPAELRWSMAAVPRERTLTWWWFERQKWVDSSQSPWSNRATAHINTRPPSTADATPCFTAGCRRAALGTPKSKHILQRSNKPPCKGVAMIF